MNSHQLVTIFQLPNSRFLIGRAVYSEVSKVESQKTQFEALIDGEKIVIYDDEIELTEIHALYEKYNLGDGETEAIAICKTVNCDLCCDDGKARKKANLEIGEGRVMGSLRLLKSAVECDIIKCTEAEISFLEMKLKGGFLPNNLNDNYFCKAS